MEFYSANTSLGILSHKYPLHMVMDANIVDSNSGKLRPIIMNSSQSAERRRKATKTTMLKGKVESSE